MDKNKYEMRDFGERIEITDDFMFGYVMRQPGICTDVIRCLLPEIPVAEVRFSDHADMLPETQKALQGNPGYHDVRLDVYLDDGKTIFNVEMQTGNKKNLPKRVRYYGAKLDCDQLEKAMDYEELRPTYVIFICTFDPFGRDEYCYRFANYDKQLDLELKDGSYKLFFNTTGHKGEISRELRGLLEYFNDPEHIPEEQKTELVMKLDGIVDIANQDADWRRKHMMYELTQLDARKMGREEGRAEGRAEGEAIGEARATNLMAKLTTFLAKEGKVEDIIRVGNDEAYRNAKMKEYGLM